VNVGSRECSERIGVSESDWGEELGVEEEEPANLFRLFSFVDVDVDCVAFPTSEYGDVRSLFDPL
jgi:hypothetical protein